MGNRSGMAGGGRIARRNDSRQKWRWRRCFSAFSVETEREREKGAGLLSGEGVRACALCPSGGRTDWRGGAGEPSRGRRGDVQWSDGRAGKSKRRRRPEERGVKAAWELNHRQR